MLPGRAEAVRKRRAGGLNREPVVEAATVGGGGGARVAPDDLLGQVGARTQTHTHTE